MSSGAGRTRIPASEIRWSSSSGADDYGRLFEWRGEVFRYIRPDVRDERLKVLGSSAVRRALKAGLLIATNEASAEVEPGDLVLRHERVPVVSYPSEWSASMLKAATCLILDLEDLLAGEELTIADANPWNVLFVGAHPVFVDVGAITRLDDPQLWRIQGIDPLFPARQQFERFFLDPLRVMSAGHDRLARALLADYWGVSRSAREALTGSFRFPARQAAKKALGIVDRPGRRLARFLLPEAARSRLRALVPTPVEPEVRPSHTVPERLPGPNERRETLSTYRSAVEEVNTPSTSFWTNYYTALHAGEVPGLEPDQRWTAKHHAVAAVLDRTTPALCLDIGSNTGWYARLAERRGAYVIAADTDDAAVSTLHRQSAEEHLRLIPLVFDVRSPTPGAGPLNRWLRPGLERLKADLVLALAVTHHLVFAQAMTFDQIAGSLAELSRQWLLAEFVPRDDEFVADLLGPQHGWYDEKHYLTAFGEHFELREEYGSFPAPRKLFLFERRSER